MPLIRISDSQNNKGEEYLQESLLVDNRTLPENAIGKTMFYFISMINDMFRNTALYGVIEHDSVFIQQTGNPKDDWRVKVQIVDGNGFEWAYKMPDKVSPWKNAIVKGYSNGMEEAKEYLVIALTECEGWEDCRELRKLYNKLKNRKTASPQFTLWLEFEEIDMGSWHPDNNFCNIHVHLEDGRSYGLTVWTYKYLETTVNENAKTGQNLNGRYQTPPDLFVKELTRNCLEQIIQSLLEVGDLDKMLNSSIYVRQDT